MFFTDLLPQMRSPERAHLVPGVTIALASSAAAPTSKLYASHFKKWKLWCAQFPEKNDFPAQDCYVALYLMNLLQSEFTFSTINSAFYLINFFHTACGFMNPCVSGFLKAVLKGCKRRDIAKARVPKQKSPILPEHLLALVSRFAGPSASLSDIRDVALCLIGFAGFLRFNEICNLKWCHITFHESHLSVFLPRSKTDQLHVGSTVLIAKTATPTCPYNMLFRYASMDRADTSSNNFVFGKLVFHRLSNSYTIRIGSQLSYSRTQEVVLHKFKEIGLPSSSLDYIPYEMVVQRRQLIGMCHPKLSKSTEGGNLTKVDLYCRSDSKHQLTVSLNLGL